MESMNSPDVGDLLHKNKKKRKRRCKYGVRGKKRGGPCLKRRRSRK